MKNYKQNLHDLVDREQYKKVLQYKQLNTEQNLIKGIRGDEFVSFIKNILVFRGKMTSDEVENLFSDNENKKMFEECFTHKSFNSEINYELYEYSGDKIVDYSIAKYILYKFPKLGILDKQTSIKLKIISKLHLYLRSKAILSKCASLLDMKKFISADSSFLSEKYIHSIYDDVFEAFIGVCDITINKLTSENVGYIICYEILKSIFDELSISIKYEFVIDARSRLKELAQQISCPYDYIMYNKQLYQTYIKFNLKNLLTNNITEEQTPIIQTNQKDKGIDQAYKSFYNYMSAIKSHDYNVSNIELVQINKGDILTGAPTDFKLSAYVIINGEQHTFPMAYGYDEKSAKENAAKNALTVLLKMGYKEKYVWNENDFM